MKFVWEDILDKAVCRNFKKNNMKGFSGLFLTVILLVTNTIAGQETLYGPGYQTLVMDNPAFAGSSMDGTLRIAYTNFLPGNNYNFHSVFCSYDSYFSNIHGGAGFYMSNDYLGGIVNDLRAGISYSYFLQAGRDLFINAGLSASLFHRGFNFSEAVFPDQIDQMGRISFPSSEVLSDKSTTAFDVGTGFMFFYKNFTGGLAINHLTQPDLDRTTKSEARLKRKYLLHLMTDFYLNRNDQTRLTPLIFSGLQENYFYVGGGAVFSYNYLSANSVLIADNNKNFDIQTGFSFKREMLALFYNYRFNISSGNSFMPFSVIHQTGLTISLYQVEKRNKFKTINVPVM